MRNEGVGVESKSTLKLDAVGEGGITMLSIRK